MQTDLPQNGGSPGTGSPIQRLRLVTGLVLFIYATTHFLNHALGLVSVEAMQAGLVVHSWLWQTWVGWAALYLSLFIHAALGIWKIINIRTWRLPITDWAQVVFALLIPYWLASHLAYTYFAENDLGIEVDYYQELPLILSGAVLQQNVLLLAVWFHGCIGLHNWFKLKRWYPDWLPVLASIAALVPSLSIAGWMTAAIKLEELAEVRRSALEAAGIDTSPTPEQIEEQEFVRMILDELGNWERYLKTIVIAVAIAALAYMFLLTMRSLFRSSHAVAYGDGRSVVALPGMTLLDVSRNNNVPHMSVCGGRARCSTCRTLVLSGHNNLSMPTEAELGLLKRLNADKDIRLACQARVHGSVEVRPLIQPNALAVAPGTTDPLGWGVERDVAILFLDIRGFSSIAEQSLPYDVIFILNSFFGEVTAEIEAANGYVDKFMGDGLMAIFGLTGDASTASRDAIRAAFNAQEACERASRILTQHLRRPIKAGIGIHVGNAVLGRIGKTQDQTGPSRLTAIGETVNIAARLEQATKDLDCQIVASQHAMDLAGLQKIASGLPDTAVTFHEIKVRNITQPVAVAALRKPSFEPLSAKSLA